MAIDVNEYVLLGDLLVKLFEYQWGLAATYHWGKDPIKSIYIYPNLQILEGGYRPVREASSNHCALWIKYKFYNLFSYKTYKIPLMVLRWVQYNNPRTIQKFNNEYNQFLLKYDLYCRIFHLQIKIQYRY